MALPGAKLKTFNTYKIFGRPAKKADGSQVVPPGEIKRAILISMRVTLIQKSLKNSRLVN